MKCLFVIVLAACSENAQVSAVDAPLEDAVGSDAVTDDATAHAISGSRLKMKWMTTADGAKVHWGVFDSQRNEDCSFRLAADGMTRCLPESVAALSNNAFSDAACTIPTFQTFSCSANLPTYVIEPFVAPTCPTDPSGRAIYIRGPKLNTIYLLSAGCVSQDVSNGSSAYYQRGARILDTEFALGSITTN